MDFEMRRPGELWFIEKILHSDIFPTTVRRVNEKPEPDGLWFLFSSGEWIRTTDLRVMSPTSCHCSTPHRLTARV